MKTKLTSHVKQFGFTVKATNEEEKVRLSELEVMYKNYRINHQIYVDGYFSALVMLCVAFNKNAPRKPLRQMKEHGVPSYAEQLHFINYVDNHCEEAFFAKVYGLHPKKVCKLHLNGDSIFHRHSINDESWQSAIKKFVVVGNIDVEGIKNWMLNNTNVSEITK